MTITERIDYAIKDTKKAMITEEDIFRYHFTEHFARGYNSACDRAIGVLMELKKEISEE